MSGPTSPPDSLNLVHELPMFGPLIIYEYLMESPWLAHGLPSWASHKGICFLLTSSRIPKGRKVEKETIRRSGSEKERESLALL